MALNRIIFYLLTLFCLLISYGCQEPFDFTSNSAGSVLIVDGTITDATEPQSVTIFSASLGKYSSKQINNSETIVTTDSSHNTPVTHAEVKILVNGKVYFKLNEVDDGVYQLPDEFQGHVGDSYQLFFKTSDGKQYQSSVETMTAVPPIKKVYDQFNPKGIFNNNGQTYAPSSDVFIDYDDPINEKNFYQWKWTLWEYQPICASCQQGYYVLYDLGNRTYGECIQDSTLDVTNHFDYPCLDFTWDIFYNKDLSIASDIYTNGQPQKGKLAAQIPLNQSNGCLVAIQQYSLTVGAYQYYKLLQDQSQNTGTLADSPPAPLVGNIKNLANTSEQILGYFSASSVFISRYYLDRKNTVGGKLNNLFFVENHRNPNLPYSGKYPHNSATCVPSKYRTCVKPLGWP